jgi:hypothetical protein
MVKSWLEVGAAPLLLATLAVPAAGSRHSSDLDHTTRESGEIAEAQPPGVSLKLPHASRGP